MAHHILVVEDEPDSQDFVATILDHIHYPYDVASDAEQAEQLLHSGRYTGVIVDLALPGKDGWELLAAIQRNPTTANLPCIAVTAYHSSKTREEALQAGFIGYFAKPLDATAFSRGLEDILGH